MVCATLNIYLLGRHHARLQCTLPSIGHPY
jgi:hypothetical protein